MSRKKTSQSKFGRPRCPDCGAELEIRHGEYRYESEVCGSLTVSGVDYAECPRCHTAVYSRRSGELIEAAEEKQRRKLLYERLAAGNPDLDSEYMASSEFAKAIGVTPQAVSSNPWFRKAFFHLDLCHRTYWLRESVQRYLEHQKQYTGLFRLAPFPGATPSPSSAESTIQ